MRNIGLTISITPFFWTLDFSYQENWKAWGIEVGPLAIRIFLPK